MLASNDQAMEKLCTRKETVCAGKTSCDEKLLAMKNFLQRAIAVAFLYFLCAPLQAQAPATSSPTTSSTTTWPIIVGDQRLNSTAQQGEPYVILVSLDGFRYDYAKQYGAPNLEKIAAQGASAPEGMIPSFPSITFPNHYTLVTGLYPEHHGIVANHFYDPARKEKYDEHDGTWYGGVPLWVLAVEQGMRSACFFWPGSEAQIDGVRPSFYAHYSATFPDDQRVAQVIDWLKLPAEQRPHFITLYFYEPDHTGHEAGPDSPQTSDAVHHVDAMVGLLMADLKELQLPVDVFVVSDHGMATVEGNWIDLDRFTDLSKFVTVGSLLYAPDEKTAARAYRQLRGASDKFVVYRRRSVPARLHFNTNPRSGDPVVIPTGPYMIRAHPSETPEIPQPKVKGEHGYDPSQMKSMRASFYAAGPDIRPGVQVQAFENIDVYPLIAHILGLHIGKIDGHLAVLRPILRSQHQSGAARR
jgi:predicted AlkP superfamily pyrophosphatase or phosphodiesterase